METQQAAKVAATQDDWYEHGFARVEGSRRRGVSSMPMAYAQTLLKWAGYAPGADLADVLVLDPACGSGNTLIAATTALAARGRVRRWGAERVAQEIEKCIWGLDPDPIACNVADLRLRRLIAHLIPDLPAARRKALQLHIHQTDSLTLPADGRFKLVITNPPLATARGVVVSYGGFESKAPPRDVWLRFLEQSMGLVAYGGHLAIALPEALLAKPSAAAIRQELIQDWTLSHLVHLTGVFRSGPGTVMLVMRRDPPTPESTIAWERIERLSLGAKHPDALRNDDAPIAAIHSRGARAERRMEGTIARAAMTSTPRGPWRYALGEAERDFLKRMSETDGTISRVKLGDLVTIGRGAELLKDGPEPTTQPTSGSVALLRGIDVEPFLAHSDRAWLATSAFKASPDVWRAPKLVAPRASARAQIALDTTGAVPLTALVTFVPQASAPTDTLMWLLALLNSRALRAYLALTQTAYQLAKPTIDLDALRSLPIALGPTDTRQRLVGLATELSRHFAMHGTSPDNTAQYPVGQRLESTINLEVNALYGLTPAEISLVDRWQL